MGEIYFVRHGQASYGAANYDKLSPLGHQQSDWLGAHLKELPRKFDHVVCGTLRRHRETLAGIERHLQHGKTVEDARLNEMPYFEIERAYCAQKHSPPPTTPDRLAEHFRLVLAAWERDEIAGVQERFAEFQARILAAFTDYTQHGRQVLLVSSGGPVGIAMRHVLGLGAEATAELILGTFNASYSRFLVRPAGVHLMQFNTVSHLERSERRHALTYL